jgi:hypothetical protein
MKIKIDDSLMDLTGKNPIVIPAIEKEPERRIKLKDIMIRAMLTPDREDDDKKKWQKYEIYKKLLKEKTEVDLTIEELALIKKFIGKYESQLIMGQCWELLEQNKK